MNDDYCLWMGDIDPRMDEYTIQNLFQFYNVFPLYIKLIKTKETNKKKNYCFIYFKNIYEANDVLNQLTGKQILNTPFKFNLNWANYLTSKDKIIYVGNLNPLVNDISLFNFFKSKYKSVLKAKIITENGKSKRYGFVTFKKGNEYRKSLIEMNGVFFNGTNIKVKEYIKKEEDVNKNNKQSLKENINNQLELNNEIINYINNNVKLLNSNSILSTSNSINKLSWISNAYPINGINIGINDNINAISKNDWLNLNISSNNFFKNNINFNNNINDNIKYNNLNSNDINNIKSINNDNKSNNNVNNIKKINKNKFNKFPKLETLEEFDEISLKIKINESLNKLLEYYKESIVFNGNSVVCKLI